MADRFDIAEAWYVYLVQYNEGQASDKYARLSKLLSSFSPRPSLSSWEDLTGEGQEVYAAIIDKHEGGFDMEVAIYGDGALLDAHVVGEDGDELREDEDGEWAHIHLTGVPALAAMDAVMYARHDNMGARPYRDGYEAMECCQKAKESSVLSCSVAWSTKECRRLGGCYLCGGMHE